MAIVGLKQSHHGRFLDVFGDAEQRNKEETQSKREHSVHRNYSPITYFRRNLGRTVPLGFVIILSVFLIASVVTIVDSIDLTVRTIYNYTKAFTPVIPRSGQLRVSKDIQAQIRQSPSVDRMIETGGFFFNVNTVFGPLPFVCFGVPDEQRDYLMQRTGDSLEPGGRMPSPGLAEAVVSEGIARNKKLKIGDFIASPQDADSSSIVAVPVPVKLVGILKGPTWIAFTPMPPCRSSRIRFWSQRKTLMTNYRLATICTTACRRSKSLSLPTPNWFTR